MNDALFFIFFNEMFIFSTILDISSIYMKNHCTVFDFLSQIFVCQQGTCSCTGEYGVQYSTVQPSGGDSRTECVLNLCGGFWGQQ